MDSDSDVDMSWVELASGEIEVKTHKRVLSLSSVEVCEEAKRCKVSDEVSLCIESGTEGAGGAGDFGGLEVDITRKVHDKMVQIEAECIKENPSTSRHPETRGVEEQEEDVERRCVAFEKRRERDEKTAFWTTPGLRPLIMDWDYFFRT